MTAAGVYHVEILNDGSVVVSRDGITAYGDTFDTAMIQWLRQYATTQKKEHLTPRTQNA